MLSVEGKLELNDVSAVLAFSESVMSTELIAAALAMVVESVEFVSLEVVEGTEISVGRGGAGLVMERVELMSTRSVDVGLVEEVELVGGTVAESRVEEVLPGASDETGVVMVSLES